MLNFSGISNRSALGKLMRLPLRLVPKDAALPIIQGPLRGKRWIAGSGNHGYWLGSFESAKQRKIIEVVRPGMVCWDVGAHVGFYTLLFAELVGPQGRVFAFEPVPRNLALLRRHVEMNGYQNVRILPVALGDSDGEARFDEAADSSMGHLARSGRLTVQCHRIDTLLRSGQVDAPDVIKMDVEGAEAAVLEGSRSVLDSGHPVLLVATHGERENAACVKLLSACGYDIRGLGGGPAEGGAELLAGPLAAQSRMGSSLLRALL